MWSAHSLTSLSLTGSSGPVFCLLWCKRHYKMRFKKYYTASTSQLIAIKRASKFKVKLAREIPIKCTSSNFVEIKMATSFSQHSIKQALPYLPVIGEKPYQPTGGIEFPKREYGKSKTSAPSDCTRINLRTPKIWGDMPPDPPSRRTSMHTTKTFLPACTDHLVCHSSGPGRTIVTTPLHDLKANANPYTSVSLHSS